MHLEPALLNTGELCDSLMGENSTNPFTEFILPLFQGTQHKVLFLTKSINVSHLLEHPEFAKNAILSWTLNVSSVSEHWEKLAPQVNERLFAAKKVYDAGYEVRIRIDPIIYDPEFWNNGEYINLIDRIFEQFRPERITLGSLRGLRTTIDNAKDKSWVKYLAEDSGWGKKPAHKIRLQVYTTLMNYLNTKYSYGKVGLCKETLSIWRDLGLTWEKNFCNCVL